MVKLKKLRGDRVIWVVLFLLALISIVSVYSSSSILAYQEDKSATSFLLKQLFFAVAGIGVILLCYIVPLGIYRKASSVLLGVSCILLLYVIIKGEVLNHAARWINILGFSFQPAELAKISVVLYLARILEAAKIVTFKDFALKVLLPIGTTVVLVLYGSVSAAIIISLIVGVILICAGVNKKFIFWTAGIGLGCIALIFTIHTLTGAFPRLDTFTSRMERFVSKEDPNLSALEKELLEEKQYQEKQAKEALQLGKITGRGPGKSLKRNTLPHSSSDFIYSIIVEEWGLMGAITVLMLYLWFFYRCLYIARYCKRVFSTIVVLGLALLITTQAIVHIFVNVGIFPVTGQTLPLISSGGTSFLIISSAFGIILSVNRTIEISAEKEKEKELQKTN